ALENGESRLHERGPGIGGHHRPRHGISHPRSLEAALRGGEGVLEAAVDRVVLHLVGEVVGVRDDVDAAADVDLLAKEALITERLEGPATDPAEAIDPYAVCHARRSPGVLVAYQLPLEARHLVRQTVLPMISQDYGARKRRV